MRIENQEGNPADLPVRIIRELEMAGQVLGLDDADIQAKLNQLFSAYPGEWAIYFVTGANLAIVPAITNDTTIPWLDTDVSGTTLRQRLVNRLNK